MCVCLQDAVLQRCYAVEPIVAIACSPDGVYCAGGGQSGTIYLWEVPSGRLLRSWPAHYKVSLPLCSSSIFSGTLLRCWSDVAASQQRPKEPGQRALDISSQQAASLALLLSFSHTFPRHTEASSSLHMECCCSTNALYGANQRLSVRLADKGALVCRQ